MEPAESKILSHSGKNTGSTLTILDNVYFPFLFCLIDLDLHILQFLILLKHKKCYSSSVSFWKPLQLLWTIKKSHDLWNLGQNELLSDVRFISWFFSRSVPRGALSPHRDPEEHLAVAPCLREEGSVAGLRLPAHLPSRLHSPGKQEGGVPGLWELDS